MAKSYEDIGKEANEFITKGYPNSGTFKIAAETQTPNGVTIKSTGTRGFDFKKDSIEEKLSAEVEPKFKVDNYEFSGKFSTLGEFEGGLTVDNIANQGVKLEGKGIHSDTDGNSVKGGASFKNDVVALKGGFKLPFSKTATHTNITGELTLRHENLFGGVDVKYDHPLPAPEGKAQPEYRLISLKGGYISKEQQAVASLESQRNKDKSTSDKNPYLSILNMFYMYSISDALKFGFGVSVEKQNLKGIEVHAATDYKIDKSTSVKSKFSFVSSSASTPDNRDFRIGLAAKQNVSERVNVTVGADINARSLIGTPGKCTTGTTKPHSFGFEIKFQ